MFLQTDLFVKSKIRSVLDIKPSEEIPTRYLMFASCCVAVANTTLVMPFDCVKTHMEKVNPSSSYVGAIKAIYSQGGLLGF